VDRIGVELQQGLDAQGFRGKGITECFENVKKKLEEEAMSDAERNGRALADAPAAV